MGRLLKHPAFDKKEFNPRRQHILFVLTGLPFIGRIISFFKS